MLFSSPHLEADGHGGPRIHLVKMAEPQIEGTWVLESILRGEPPTTQEYQFQT